jgi:hypothetical protein
VVRREVAKGRDILAGVEKHLGDQWELAPHHGGELFHLTFDVKSVGLGEVRADYGRDHGLLGLGHFDEHDAHEVDPAALPADPGKDLGDGGLEAQVRITDHERDVREPPFTQALEELGPKGRVLGVADGKLSAARKPPPPLAIDVLDLSG